MHVHFLTQSTSLHINVFFCTKKSIFVASKNYGWTTDVTWTILQMSLLCFWTLIVLITLLSMEGQKALKFHQKYLNLCSEDEQRFYRFGMTWAWAINDIIVIFGWTDPLSLSSGQVEWKSVCFDAFGLNSSARSQCKEQVDSLFLMAPRIVSEDWSENLVLQLRHNVMSSQRNIEWCW